MEKMCGLLAKLRQLIDHELEVEWQAALSVLALRYSPLGIDKYRRIEWFIANDGGKASVFSMHINDEQPDDVEFQQFMGNPTVMKSI
jgi:hypothetical protein